MRGVVFIRSLRVVVKNALRVVAKPRRGAAPASFGASRKAFLTHNAPWQKQCQQTLAPSLSKVWGYFFCYAINLTLLWSCI